MYLYMHISPSGKKYIGITIQEPKERWKGGKGYKNNAYFYHAIIKYGWDNFQHIIIFDNLTEEEANEKESELIEKYDLTNPKKGYNLRKGGRHHGFSEISKQKLKKSLKGKFCGENNPFYGKHHTEETLLKIRKRVEQYSLDGEYITTYESIKEAHNMTGADMSEIVKGCNGKRKTVLGYQWKYENSDKEIKPYKRTSHNKRKVGMYSLSGEKLAVFESLAAAGQTFGINADKSIGDCCRNEQPTAYGYIWKYES